MALAAIKMASDILARAERTAKETKLLGHISQSTDRVERMIADLLNLALTRVGSGIAIAPAAQDLQAFVSHSVDELRVAFPNAALPLCQYKTTAGYSAVAAGRAV
ncbi:hypothetical protein [Pseudomonas sp. O230]|uniref:hypothetical protein n=1 Tax=Pseudomonas sp. O230 TaxID=3159450 RepID=UPI00387B5C4F